MVEKRTLDEAMTLVEQADHEKTGNKASAKKRVSYSYILTDHVQILNKGSKVTEEEEKEEKENQTSTEAESVALSDTTTGATKTPLITYVSESRSISDQFLLQTDCLGSYEAFINELGNWQDPLGDYLKRPAFKQVF